MILVEAILNNWMTPYEHDHQEAIRLKRMARQEANHLLRRYAPMRKMFKAMGKSGFARRIAG